MDDLISTKGVYSTLDLVRLDCVVSGLVKYAETRDESHLVFAQEMKIKPLQFVVRPLAAFEKAIIDQAGRGIRAAFVFGCSEIRNYPSDDPSKTSAKPSLKQQCGDIQKTIWNDTAGEEFDRVCEEIGFDVIDEIARFIYDRSLLGKRYRGTVPYAVPPSLPREVVENERRRAVSNQSSSEAESFAR